MDVKTTHETLNWLLERYFENPNSVWDISRSFDRESGVSETQVHELGLFLASKGYVKNHKVIDEGFVCCITTLGINQVSNIFTQIKYKILHASIEHKKRSISEILGIEAGHFRKVHDYATYLKRLGIIECIFHADDVHAEPTFYGREWYEENKFKFAS
jgi:hypothetical protein